MNFSFQNLNNIFSDLGFNDVVDILIITAVVFAILGFIHNSRAAQLAKGLIILVVASLVASLAHFYTVKWILEQILDIGLIALVVIFQPELRRALEFLGRGRFGNGNMTMTQEMAMANVDVIVRSVEYFSARREGALIVLERKTALMDIAETGTIIDAKLTEQGLENIFYKGAPLHDGAAIIRGDRILAAGCVLPLTENQSLSKDLGTRHRAGIGVSEVSDAIVVIVSEETGIISVASDGKLSRFLDLRTVEKTLMGYYLSKVKDQSADKGIRGWLWRPKKNEQQKEND